MKVRVRKSVFRRPRVGSYTSRRARIGRASIGGPVDAVLRGRALVRKRGGDPYPTRPVPLRMFYRNGVVHPQARSGYDHFGRLGWGMPPQSPTEGMVYAKVAKRVWRWVAKRDVPCVCSWCRMSWQKWDDFGWKAMERRRMESIEDPRLAHMASYALSVSAHVWTGCERGAERRVYVGRLLKVFLDAAAVYLEGEPCNVVRATVTYAARRMADPRCLKLMKLLESGQGLAACSWLYDAARRHPGAGKLVFPGIETFRRRAS